MSSPITVDIPHQLGAVEARRRIDAGFAKLAEQISGVAAAQVRRSWEGDRMLFAFSALGQSITGQLLVLGDLVRIQVLLPGVLGALAQLIQQRVASQGKLLLDKK